jgi:TonB-linked SusC/RagA family outer membrane protein
MSLALGTLESGRLAAQASQTGIVTGRVTDAATSQPIASVQVGVIGTNLGAQSNVEGQYTIRGVPAGTAELRVLRVGFAEMKATVTVTAGQPVTQDFAMRAVATTLAPVVTTATGDQRRIEVGNAVAQVNVSEVMQNSAVTNVADLLTSRAAGVMVIPGTQTGAGIRVRVRGTSSLSLTNNPIYIIDGIRVEGSTGSSSIGVGGTTASRVGDLNPEEIQSIEVVRGPSASTLYGTDAANGVIVITTKRGVAGRPQWTYYTEQTAIRDFNDYPTAFWGWRTGTTPATTSSPSNQVQCFLSQAAAGVCSQDSVTSFNLHDDDETTPYGLGYRQQHGLQLGGGSETIRYFLHGEWEDEDGVTKVPDFDKRILSARGQEFRTEQLNPNRLTRFTNRANVNVTLPSNIDFAANAGYNSQDLWLPRSDDSGTPGIAANTYGGPGFKYNLNAAGDTLFGWREFTPKDIYEATTKQAIERLITSTNANWRPMGWLALRGNFGVDYINRSETQICRFGDCTNVTDRQGFKIDNRTNFYVYTGDVAATATRRLGETIESQTTGGVQFTRNILSRNGAVGEQLPPGAVTVTSGAVLRADETTSESRTLGGFLEQRIAWRDRLFVTGAIRSDRNSAFGADFETVFYPKLAASWVVSDESFFPDLPLVNQLRIRSAFGASGVQPGTTDAVQFFAPTKTLGESGEVSGVVFSTLGNANLKPERSTELEIGIDGDFWDHRLSAEVTYYNKYSKDALISRVLPPSIGTGATSRFENLGAVRNMGWEFLVNARLLQRPTFGWDMTLNASTNDNAIIGLGGVPPITSATVQQRQRFCSADDECTRRYPLNGWWARHLTGWEDKDGDGIIEYNTNPTLSEITVTDTAVFIGYPIPKYELALVNGFEFWQRRIRLSAMIDMKGGHLIYNNSERIRCASRNNCQGLIDPNASLYEQARTVAVREHPSRTVAGFFEDGDFIRFRELSLSFQAPDEWARWLRGRSLVASFAARNLGILKTDYLGVDPEAFGTTGDAPSSFQAFAPPTYFAFRLNFGF